MTALLVLAIAMLVLNYWLCLPVRASEPAQRSNTAVVFSIGALIATAPSVWVIAKLLSSPQVFPLRAVACVLVLSILIQLAVRLLRARIELAPQDAAVLRRRTLLNCNVFALALLHSTLLAGFGMTLLLGIAVGIMFELALYVFTEQQERVARLPVPEPFRGAPLTLISAGVMALALMGLQGLL